MDPELRLYQQIHAKLKKQPREVQIRTLSWLANKLHEEHEEVSQEPPVPE